MRWRSASWAASARRLLSWRSASSRSSIRLKAWTSRPISSWLVIGTRWPGRRRSTVPIRRTSRSSGANARRRSTTFAASVTARPARRPTASASLIGVLTVTGVTSRTTRTATSNPALTAKTRQNSESRPKRATGIPTGVLARRRRDHHGDRRLPGELGRERGGRGAKAAAAAGADEDQVRGLLARDAREQRGRMAHGVAALRRAVEAVIGGQPLEHASGPAARDVHEDEAEPEALAERDRRVECGVALRPVGQTADD